MVGLVASLLCLLVVQGDQSPPVRFDLEVVRSQTQTTVQPGDTLFLGETLWLQLHIDMEQAFFEQQLLPQWRSPLDFQAELTTPWAEPSLDFRVLDTEGQGDTSMVIDRDEGKIQRLEDLAEGRIHFQLRRKIQLQGKLLHVPPAKLKLVWATEFEEDMIRGLVPVDRQTKTFTTEAFHLDILLPPTEGQPLDFFGAIGDFTMELSEQENQGTRALQIVFHGKGLLTSAQLPRLGQLPNFPLSAQRFELQDQGITVYLETLSEAPFPLVSWSFFQPSTASYVTHTIGADSSTAASSGQSRNKWTPWIWLTGFAVLLLGVFFWPKTKTTTVSGAKQSVRVGAKQSTVPGTKKSAVKPAIREPQDLVDDLAQLLHCSREDLYSNHLATRFSGVGIDAALAEECSSAIQAIFQARYANRGTLPSDATLTALRKRLQARS